MDSTTSLQDLKEAIRKFCEERDWDQYHNPKDLAIGIITEASELLEHFLWKSEKDVTGFVNNPQKKEQIEDEMADVLYFLLRLSQNGSWAASARGRRRLSLWLQQASFELA